jgi:hypothetical protein
MCHTASAYLDRWGGEGWKVRRVGEDGGMRDNSHPRVVNVQPRRDLETTDGGMLQNASVKLNPANQALS